MLKGKAKNLLHSFLDSLDKKDDTPPPKPPPKTDNPVPHFDSLSISHDKPVSSPSRANFVGGFNPAYSVNPYAYTPNPNNYVSSAPNLSKPTQIAMPTPFDDTQPHAQSLTMQMALRPPGSDLPTPTLSHRPYSNPNPNTLPPPTPASDTIRPSISSASSAPFSTPSKPPRKKPASSTSTSTPSTPVKASGGRKPRTSISSAVSASPSAPATPKPGQEQCAGITKAGKRCTRMVKVTVSLAKSAFDEDEEEEEEEEKTPRFCHQHSKELMGPSGYYARKNGEWVSFDDWIPAYLQSETQVSLRVEMEKTKSKSDKDGYIYTFEIREPGQRETIKLKVGRAVNLVKRIDQWGKQCGSKEQVLRGFYPGTVESDEDGNEGSLMKGRVKAGEKGPLCHRLERLIHLELADLASNAAYLDPKWPNIDAPPPADDAKDSGSSIGPCADCGSVHKEIFEFKRWKKGKHRGKEWEQVVKPVIDRWGRFVDLYV